MTAVAAPREEAEIAVVGAGPAGCVAAANLAELGHDVLLIDKDSFPREKPCGDGLGHAAVAVAERLGLEELVEAAPEIASARVMIAHRRQTSIQFPRSPGRPLPRCIPRKEFDAAL
ncbi:MAG TPA: FAD-dependent oxidoreductase, partial [Solirubrobacterales bacterium]|nr:FAD-dependent oxidoreductase [Solirubrobacterales bacterium]